MLHKIFHTLSLNPKRLLLIDGLGAIVSAFLLGVVLVYFEGIFGIPRKTLYFLAFLPCIFAVYDAYCYLRIDERLDVFLRIIAFTNLSYCFISLGLAFYHHQKLSYWGWAYILLEILIVVILVCIELKIASKIKIELK